MHTSRPRILIVDDEPNVLLTVEAILRQEGYETSAVSSGAAAIEAIHQHHYDLVLTDLKMPGVDGLEVLQEVRNCSPDTVTVMMTGYGSVDSALEAVQLGAYEYLLKPTDVGDLKAAVRRSLERKRLSEIDTLYRISRTLTRARDSGHIHSEVEEAVRRVLNVAHACVISFDPHHCALPQCADSLRPVFCDERLLAHLASGAILGVEDEASHALRAWAEQAGRTAFVCVPGVARERLVCALVVDNGDQPFEFHAAAVRFLQGVASQTALALENAALISELQKNNEQLASANGKLRELDKLKSQFLTIATHELRTPLSIILGYNAMLAESLNDRLTAEERETLRESVRACQRLIRLVNSMLDITQIESGAMQMNYASVDLRQVAANVVALFQAEAHAKNLRLSLEVAPQLPRVQADAERVEQVLVNLIGNALKFTMQGAIHVSVQPRPQPPAIEVAVADTGIGIAVDEQQRLFDEFAQIRRQNAKRQREGSGLGLAISRRIVEAHQGRIQVESTPGHGTTFRFYIPFREHLADQAISA